VDQNGVLFMGDNHAVPSILYLSLVISSSNGEATQIVHTWLLAMSFPSQEHSKQSFSDLQKEQK
jgi:hypothetical protein